uniref:Uncharacterized protein n=1 Tax=Hyaloperonospora arabidopsidis (strain Emoy2) TaxID=559515 RepID=M4BCI9_HYAAE
MPNTECFPGWKDQEVKVEVFSERLSLPEDTIKLLSGSSQRFKLRNKLRSLSVYGESGLANEEAMDAALAGLRAVIDRCEPKDVFNMGET